MLYISVNSDLVGMVLAHFHPYICKFHVVGN